MPLGLLLAAVLAPADGLARAGCLSDEVIERAVGAQVRSGAPFVDTSGLPDQPLCSGLTLAQQIQRIRAAAFPEEQRAAAAAQQALIARDEQAALARIAPAPVADLPEETPAAVERATPRAAAHARPAKRAERPRSTPVRRRASGASYPSCRAARAAGAAPIRSGEPGYSRRLDRDGDGIACE